MAAQMATLQECRWHARDPGPAGIRPGAFAATEARGGPSSSQAFFPGSRWRAGLRRPTSSTTSANGEESPQMRQVWELETVLTDAAIAVFEDLTGQMFDRSKNRQERS